MAGLRLGWDWRAGEVQARGNPDEVPTCRDSAKSESQASRGGRQWLLPSASILLGS